MRFAIFSAAALAAAAFAPALAQTAPATDHSAHGKHHSMRMESMTRAQMLEKVQAHFAKIDADKNGVVTKAEADAMRAERREHIVKRVEKRSEHRFERIGTNNDGQISRPEFDAAHARMAERKGKAPHIRVRMHSAMHGRIFEMADANNDGSVTLQEATSAAAAHFDRADANRDGILTPEEMRAAHKAHMGKAGA